VDTVSTILVIELEINDEFRWPNFLRSLALGPGGTLKLIEITTTGKNEKRLKHAGKRLSLQNQ
jgi:hypothetical protein